MTAIRAVRAAEGHFIMLTNEAGQDTQLSLQARGIIYYVLSLPADTHLTAKLIEDNAPNGRESVRGALRELEQRGYFQRTRTNVHGRWVWEQTISDAPFAKPQVASCDGNPSDGSPADGSPSDGSLSDKDFKDGNPKDEDLKDDRDSLRSSPSSQLASLDSDTVTLTTPGLDEQGSREDVDRICCHLADRVEQRYGKRPNIIKRWRTAARQMLDLDGLTEEQVHAAIDWAQNNEFWAPNIRSVSKLREKYIQLRAAAIRERERDGGYKPSTTDARVLAAAEVAARYRAQEAREELEAAGQLQITQGT